VADPPDLAVNGRLGSVSIAGCTGRTRALRGSRLEAWNETPGPGKADSGEARHGGDGEQSHVQESGEMGKRGRRCSLRQRRGTVTTVSNRTCGKAGKRGKRGWRCSLRQRGAPGARARRRKARSGCTSGGRGRLGFARLGGGCGFCGTEGAGRWLYRAAEGPRCAGLGRRASGGRATAGLRRESELGSSLRTDPIGGSHLAAREKKGRREGASGWAGWAGGGGEAGWAGWAARWRKKRKAAGWVMREEKKREEEERERGPGQKRKRVKEMHPNAFEFKFKI
jgi:hypothetical protein